MDILKWIEEWYNNNCDGDWEHGYGVSIDTLDNPGWKVNINLEGTTLEDTVFNQVDDRFRSENDWIICTVENNVFKGCGGPKNLVEILTIFKNWVED